MEVGFEPIVLKNSKIRRTQFSANFHCSNKVDATCSEQAMTAAHIVKPEFWPTPLQKIYTASQRVTFSPMFSRTGVFQHNQPLAVLSTHSPTPSPTHPA
jgi:hypothetical protein